jgi:hypothetical protein
LKSNFLSENQKKEPIMKKFAFVSLFTAALLLVVGCSNYGAGVTAPSIPQNNNATAVVEISFALNQYGNLGKKLATPVALDNSLIVTIGSGSMESEATIIRSDTISLVNPDSTKIKYTLQRNSPYWLDAIQYDSKNPNGVARRCSQVFTVGDVDTFPLSVECKAYGFNLHAKVVLKGSSIYNKADSMSFTWKPIILGSTGYLGWGKDTAFAPGSRDTVKIVGQLYAEYAWQLSLYIHCNDTSFYTGVVNTPVLACSGSYSLMMNLVGYKGGQVLAKVTFALDQYGEIVLDVIIP